MPARFRRSHRPGGDAFHAAHPYPALPTALATASALQQAAISTGAGPPQQLAAAVLGGVDLIVFTAGIGENSAVIRHRVLQRLDFLGARLDEDKNRTVKVTREAPTAVISEDHSRTRLMVVATDEAQAIASDTAKLAGEADKVGAGRIPIAISARHVHLNRQTVALLFGEGAKLTEYKPLSQPGQFSCNEKVNLIGPKGRIDGVRLLAQQLDEQRGQCGTSLSASPARGPVLPRSHR